MSNVPTNLIPTRITGLPEYMGTSTLGYIPYILDGRTYKVQFGQIAAVGAVPSTRVIAAGTGLAGGGDLSENRVISIANGGVGFDQLSATGVVAGSYGSGSAVPVITVDLKGRVTDISTTPLVITGYVPDSRLISTGAGLLGGGSLASNRTLSVDFSSATPQALGSATAGVSNAAARGDHVHPAVNLSDTTQTQGALPLGRGGTGDALSPVAGAVVYSTGTKFALADPGDPGQVLTSAGAGEPYWATIAGTGTVTSVSVLTANGFGGTVAFPDTTPQITLNTTVTGIIKGDGTSMTAASPGVDYALPGANNDITSMTGLTGGISTPDYIDFDTGATVARATGRLWWDNADGIQTLNLGMAGSNATLQIGEEMYFRIKASSAITEGQVVMFTGTVGNSGALTGAPATGLTKDTASYIMGVATESIALNGWGYVTQFGLVRSIDTTGGAEAWVDGQILYYDPAVAGGLTKNVPAAPNAKVEVAAVVNAASNGSLFVRPIARFSLGQLNDVETAAATNNDLLQYNGASGYWQHKAPSLISVGTATNLAGGAANRIAYQTGAGATSFITAPTVANTFLEWSGSAFQWSSNPLGTVTSVAASGGSTGLTFSGSPITTSGTLTLGGTLALASGGTGSTTAAGARTNLGLGTAAVLNAGVANGVATLDSAGTVPTSQLPAAVLGALNYQGTWNASTNTPTLTSSVGTKGYYYVVDVAGSTNLNGITDWKVGDWAVYSGTAWQKIDNTDGVTSVNGYTGAVSLTYSDVGAPSATGTGASGTWNISVTGNAANVSGVVAVANGGTGATSLTSGYLVKGNGTSAVSASVVYDNGTNVGIGTTSPAVKLDVVNGDIRAYNGVLSSFGVAGTATLNLYQNSGNWRISNPGGYLQFYDITAGTERMRIDNVGNIGIGTSSPAARLHVVNSVIGSQFRIQDNTTDATAKYGTATFGHYTNAQAGILGLGVGSLSASSTVYIGGGFGTLNAATAIQFYTAANNTTTTGSERMRIDSSGNVGIGTSSPGAKLAVASGNINLTDLYALNWGVQSTYIYGSSSAGNIKLATNNTDRVTVDASGNVGIGVTPSAWTVTALQMASSSAIGFNNQYGEIDTNAYYNAGYKYIGTGLAAKYGQEAGVHKWFTAPSGTAGAAISFTQAMTLDASGNLGIGTSSPTEKLVLNSSSAIQVATKYINTNTTGVSVGAAADGSAFVYQASALPFIVYTNGTERMRISSAGYVGVGTSSPSFPLDVQSTGVGSTIAARIFRSDGTVALLRIGNSTSGSASSAPAFGSDTTAAVVYTNNTERMRIDASGNVGIGTSSPAYKLDVSGVINTNAALRMVPTNVGAFTRAQLQSAYNLDGTAASVFTWNYTNGGGELDLFINRDGGGVGGLKIYDFPNTSGNPTNILTVEGGGNVGIGTTSPLGSSGYGWLTVNGSSNGAATSWSTAGTENFRVQVNNGVSAVYLNTISNWPMLFQTNNTERMRIDASGNVGIGTSSPGAALSVVFNSTAHNGMRVTNNSTTQYAGSGLQMLGPSAAGAQGGSAIYQFNTTVGGTAGGLGIAQLDYNGSWQRNIAIYDYSTQYWGLYTNGSERFRIDSSGRVGIGTSTPATQLDVVSAAGTDCQIAVRGGNAAYAVLQGTSFPNFNALQCYDSSGNLYWSIGGNGTANSLAFLVNGSVERFRIASTGAWGLSGANYGTSGQVLTSNGSGSAPTWQSVSGGTVSYPQNVQSGNYTLVLSDAGKQIYSANSAAQTITIPTNASVAFPIGTLITIVNMGTYPIRVSGSGVSILPNGGTTALSFAAVASGQNVQIVKTGTDTWSCTFGSLNNGQFSYLIVAGGGAGGGVPAGGGGGAGGMLTGVSNVASGTLTITVGAGGAATSAQGNNSSITGLGTAFGGGGGGPTGSISINGGSGGGCNQTYNAGTLRGGLGLYGQGNAGGASSNGHYCGAGGGGAGAVGANVFNFNGGAGGTGLASSITGSSVFYAGGGSGGSVYGPITAGGAGGGGAGGGTTANGVSGTANTGGGGGGAGDYSYPNAGAGGSGVVIISTPIAAASTTGSPTVTTSGGNTIYTFTSSGTITW